MESNYLHELNKNQLGKIDTTFSAIKEINCIISEFEKLCDTANCNTPLMSKFSINSAKYLKYGKMIVFKSNISTLFAKLNIDIKNGNFFGNINIYTICNTKKIDLAKAIIMNGTNKYILSVSDGTKWFHSRDQEILLNLFFLYPFNELINKIKSGELNAN